MLLLSTPFDPAAAAPPRPSWEAYVRVGGAVATLAALGLGWERLGAGPAGLGHAVAGGAVHAGWLALGWVLATGAAPGWRAPTFRLGATMIAASLVARLGAAGPLAYLVGAVALLAQARRHPPLRAVGLAGARPSHALAGLVLGAFLGVHLLVTASRTLGYRLQAGGLSAYLGALAYDIGANALTAEWLFRGAVFSLLWRRVTFWPAALLSTGLSLLRYLLDPALPDAAEARVGAVFYLGLVGLIACALRAWSGSLLPGYLAALGFFAAYRMLAP
ncbi:MAG TPA: CPBP family glutamic-type intramembrane protease [Methylomirabilota bacterium]|nr:CPBP family glutamic-type intramembrane protease [Methylomirabilota bacterium]